jgi:dolichyl-phosphate beta-glucosyltransferase
LVSLSIVIPAYNEEKRLQKTLDAVAGFIAGRAWSFIEVIVVNDGSIDGTPNLVTAAAKRNPVFRVLSNPGNRGKGYSVRHGMIEARGDWRLFTDADLSAPIAEFDKLLSAAESAGAAVAFGSRALDRSLVEKHQSMFREYSGRFFNLVMQLITGLPYRDTQCGFKLYRADAARAIFGRQQLDGFGFDVENLFIARLLGFQSVEVPVRWSDVAGTKVSTLRGLDAFADIVRVRWNHLLGAYR